MMLRTLLLFFSFLKDEKEKRNETVDEEISSGEMMRLKKWQWH